MKGNNVQKLIGAGAALLAISVGILNHVDPLACVGRAFLAFVLGGIGYQVWYVFVTSHAPTNVLRIETGQLQSEGETGQSKAA